MNTQTRRNSLLIVAAMLAILALTSLACSFSGPRVGTVSSVVDITLTQEMFDRMSRNSEVHLGDDCELLKEVTRVELHDGFIRFLGKNIQSDGTEVDGSFDLSLGAEDDLLKARIVAVDIPGVTLKDSCIVGANIEMAMDLSELAEDPQGEVLFKEVVVEEGALRMKVQVNVDL
jgi:hypothetical protein